MVGLNRLLHHGRHGIQVRFLFVPGVEIEHGKEESTQLLRCHFRDILLEVDIEVGSVRIGRRLIAGQGNLLPIRPLDLDTVVPLLAMNRTAVDIEMNVVVLDLHIREVGRIARPYRWPPEGESLLQLGTVGRRHAVSQLDPFGAHGKEGSRVDDLGLEVPDDFIAGLLRHVRSVGRNGWGGRWRWLRLSAGRRRRGMFLRWSWRSALSADEDRREKNGQKQEGRDSKTFHKPPQGDLAVL